MGLFRPNDHHRTGTGHQGEQPGDPLSPLVAWRPIIKTSPMAKRDSLAGRVLKRALCSRPMHRAPIQNSEHGRGSGRTPRWHARDEKPLQMAMEATMPTSSSNPSPSSTTEHEHQAQGPEEVELFLQRERPHVQQGLGGCFPSKYPLPSRKISWRPKGRRTGRKAPTAHRPRRHQVPANRTRRW